MKVEALILHLKRAEKRREQVDKLVGDLPLSASVLDAMDGLALLANEIEAAYKPRLHRPHYPFVLRKQEIGCFLSHRRAWQIIIERGLDAGLIVEDDVEIDAEFPGVLARATKAIRPGDYIRFPRWARGERGLEVPLGENVSIIEPRLPGLGMQMQLIGREAAAALLKATATFDRPVDTTIQMRWLHAARVLSMRPICIREIDDALGGTVIQNKSKSTAEMLRREIRRPLYRLTVAAYNAAGLGKR